MNEGKCPHKIQVDFDNCIENIKQDIVHISRTRLVFWTPTAVPLKKIQVNVDNFIWMRFIFGYTFREHIHY